MQFALLSILSGLMLTMSVPAMAQKAPPECELIKSCPGKGDLGVVKKSEEGLVVRTPKGTITVDKTTSPPTVTFLDCDPLVEKDCDDF